jgi:hypothetical protein
VKNTQIEKALQKLDWIAKLTEKPLPNGVPTTESDICALSNHIVRDTCTACKILSNSSDLSDPIQHRPTPASKSTLTQNTIPQDDFEHLANKLLENGNMVRFRAHGRSMLPFIKDGDILTIAPINSDNLKKYDIVFYRKPDKKLAAHRIISKSKKNESILFHIRGDGYVGGTEKIPATDIMGVITKVERNNTKIKLNSLKIKLATIGWTTIQSIRWFIYRVKRKLFVTSKRSE